MLHIIIIVNHEGQSRLQPSKKIDFIISLLLGLDEQNISNSVYYTLIILYAFVIGLGVAGNVMILWGILSKSAMRTARNYFIVRYED